jgi:hypothetical protein
LSSNIIQFPSALRNPGSDHNDLSPVALAMSGFYELEPGAPLNLDPAVVIRTTLRFAARKGRCMANIPEFIRSQLLLLCEAGDPTSILVRDWLLGKGPFAEGVVSSSNQSIAHEDGEGRA